MKQRSIVIAITVLATNFLAGVFATSQPVYADNSSETEVNIKEKKEVDINGDGNTVSQCSKNNLDSFNAASEVVDSEYSNIESDPQ